MDGNADVINLYDIPINALRFSTRKVLIDELNKRKVLPSATGKPRDYRGLAELMGLTVTSVNNPTKQLLVEWQNNPHSSLGQLLDILGQLDRWDIVDDVQQYFREDAKVFSFPNAVSNQGEQEEPELESSVLTYDDGIRLANGQPLTHYDTLLLYADAPKDQEFAAQVADRLESEGLTVCRRDDVVGGFMFEHRAAIKLVNERCRHVVVIVSQKFIESRFNQFVVHFAQSLSIQKQRRIIIPCLLERDLKRLPVEINLLHKLDYNRHHLMHYNFWERLVASVQMPRLQISDRESHPRITEVNSTTEQLRTEDERSSKSSKSSKSMTNLLSIGSHSTTSHSSILHSEMRHTSATSTTTIGASLSDFSKTNFLTKPEKPKSKSTSEFVQKLFKKVKFPKKTKKIAVVAEC